MAVAEAEEEAAVEVTAVEVTAVVVMAEVVAVAEDGVDGEAVVVIIVATPATLLETAPVVDLDKLCCF